MEHRDYYEQMHKDFMKDKVIAVFGKNEIVDETVLYLKEMGAEIISVTEAEAFPGKIDAALVAADISETVQQSMVYLESVLEACKVSINCMKKAGGSVVLLTSAAGKYGTMNPLFKYKPTELEAGYTAMAAGVIGVMKTLANQNAPYNVRVNTVAVNKQYDKDQQMERIYTGKPATPKEIIQPIVFFLSEFSSYITGYCMDVTGGLYMD